MVVVVGSVVARQFLGWSPVTRVVVGRRVRTRAPLPCDCEQLRVLLVSASVYVVEPPTALVYRVCPARTHQCVTMSKVTW